MRFLPAPQLLVSVLLLLFLLLNFDSISGDYCYPDCDNPSSALKFNSDGTLGKLENLKIDYLAGLTFYQNNFVAIYFENLKIDKTHIFHFSNCDDLLKNLDQNEGNAILLLPDSEKMDLKRKEVNKTFSQKVESKMGIELLINKMLSKKSYAIDYKFEKDYSFISFCSNNEVSYYIEFEIVRESKKIS